MSIHPHHKLAGTADQDYQLCVDELVIPIVAGPAIGTVVGSLLPWVLLAAGVYSVSLSGSTITVLMREDYNFRPGSAFLLKATVEGGAAKWDAKLESWDVTLKKFTFRTYNAAGALTAPPVGAAIHFLAVHRY